MWKAIDLSKLDDLLKDYKEFKTKGESFSSFVESTTDDEIPIWDWIDSIGVVTPEDFYSEDLGELLIRNLQKKTLKIQHTIGFLD